MLQKIVSSGLNSVARAALDVALHLDIAHSGWISKGGVAAQRQAAAPYELQELPSNRDCMEKCVTTTDGTLLLTRGGLDADLNACLDFAQINGRHFLHIDLERVPAFKASTVIADWLIQNNVHVLNVTGPESDDAPDIYEKIFHVITSAYWLCQDKNDGATTQGSGRTRHRVPRSVSEAVSLLKTEMSLKDRATMANMTENELANLNSTLGAFIRNAFGIWSGNEKLLRDCRSASGDPTLSRKETATVIIRELWKELRQTHKLRIVK